MLKKTRGTVQAEKLVMVGVVNDQKKVSIAQSFLTKEDFPLTPDADSEYELVFIDREGTILARNGFLLTPIQDANETRQNISEIFSVVKPFPKGTVRVEIRHRSISLASLVCSDHAPNVMAVNVKLREPLPPVINWKATDEDGNPLQYTVLYSRDNGHTFQPIGVGLHEMEYIWDHSTTPGSDQAVIKIIASNGLREGSATSLPFQLPKKAPKIAILTPKDGEVFIEGSPIALHGLGYDPEDGELNGQDLKWWLDGTNLGTGQSLRIKGLPQETPEGLVSAPINPGIHTITLTAIDSDKNKVGVQIHINIIPETKETDDHTKRTRIESP